MAIEIFKLVGSVFVDTDAANKSLKKTDKQAVDVGKTLVKGIGTVAKWGTAIVAATGAATTAVAAFAAKTAETADHIDKMSQKLGISRQAYQELDFILSQSGTSVDGLKSGMKKLTDVLANAKNATEDTTLAEMELNEMLESGEITIEEYNEQYDSLINGSKKACEAFDKLGISMDEVNSMSTEDALFAVIQKLQEMPDDATRAALATDLLGKSAQELAPLLNSGVGSIEEMKKQAHELGLVMSDEVIDNGVNLTDSLDQTKRALKGIVTMVGSLFMPIVEKASDAMQIGLKHISGFLSDKVPKITKFITSFIEGVTSSTNTFEEAGNRYKKIWDSLIQPIIDFAIGYYNFFKENLDTVFSLYADEFGIMSEFLDMYWTTTVEPILDALKRMLESTFNLVLENMPFMLEQTRKAMDGIKDCWDKIQPAMLTFAKTLQEQVLPAIILVFEKILLPVAEKTIVWLAVFISETLIPTFAGLCEFLSGVFTGDFEMALNGIFEMSNVVLGDILNLFITIFNQAAENVKTSIEKIKSFLDFEWSLPELKMPHFKMDGEFSLTPPSVPTISVDWYKKAMDNPIIMDKPTAFGINSDGQIMAGGEAGREIVSGASTLMSMISEATAKNNEEMVSALYLILQALQEMNEELPERLRDAIEDTSLKISNREFARLVKAVN